MFVISPVSEAHAESSPISSAPERTDWVLATPFRSHVRQLMSECNLPWRVIAMAAGVPSGVVRDLLGHSGRPRAMRRIRAQDAACLLTLTAAVLNRMRNTLMSGALARQAINTLRSAGHDDAKIANWLHLTVRELRALTVEQTATTELLTCHALAACEAWGLALESAEDLWDDAAGDSNEMSDWAA